MLSRVFVHSAAIAPRCVAPALVHARRLASIADGWTPPTAMDAPAALSAAELKSQSKSKSATSTKKTSKKAASSKTQASTSKATKTKKKKKMERPANKAPRATSINTIVYDLSQELSDIVGTSSDTRTNVSKEIWKYIKSHRLQDEKNRRMILCDDLLKKLFKKDQIEMLEIAKDIQPHFLSPTEK